MTKIDAAASTPLLTLAQAAERLATLGVGHRLAAIGSPPIAARGPKGAPLFAIADLDAWAAALPRRRRPARGEDVTESASQMVTAWQTPQRPWFAEPTGEDDELGLPQTETARLR